MEELSFCKSTTSSDRHDRIPEKVSSFIPGFIVLRFRLVVLGSRAFVVLVFRLVVQGSRSFVVLVFRLVVLGSRSFVVLALGLS